MSQNWGCRGGGRLLGGVQNFFMFRVLGSVSCCCIGLSDRSVRSALSCLPLDPLFLHRFRLLLSGNRRHGAHKRVSNCDAVQDGRIQTRYVILTLQAFHLLLSLS